MAESGGCCRCCCSFILTSGLTALFLWLSLRTTNPTCSIQSFYLPALNKSLNSNLQNSTLRLELKLQNPNKDKGIYYDAINLTFNYPPPNLTTTTHRDPVGGMSIKGFYQGHRKKAKRIENVDMRGVNWSHVLSQNQTVVFRVDLMTAVRFKILFWKTKRHGLKVGANVEVNDQGAKVNKKGIKLKSGARQLQLQQYSFP